MPDETHLEAEWKPKYNPWAIALTVTLATFMEVLDTSIANVALPHIAGSLGASQEEATWVLTSYLVSSAVVLPISGWLSNRFGRKRFYMTCVAIFTVCSLLCGLAPTLPILIIARILQGAGGGGLAPSEQAILADTFSVEKRGQAFALYGTAVVIAPAIGPTLGGYITDNFNWHWIFFINLPIGLLSLWLSNRMVEDPPKAKALTHIKAPVDFTGLALVAGGVGCLEFFLDKGQEKDWFGDPMICTVAAIAVFLLTFFVIWEWRHPDPIVDLKLLKNRNFGTAVFLQLILGMVLFGSTVLIPQYLQALLGYTAERAGMVLSPAGFVMMFGMALAGRSLSWRIDPRLTVCLGYMATAIGLYNLTRLSLDTSFGTATLWRMLQVIGLPFIFIPISTLNYVGVPRSKSNQISSLSNFARNLGGSAGTALLTTFLARTAQTHQNQLSANAVPGTVPYMQYMNSVAAALRHGGMSAAQSAQLAVGYGYQQMLRQASMLSYQNAFFMLAVSVFCLCPLPFLMRLPAKAEKPSPEEVMAH
ncbi:DHA2 family efflux MFS transporter permease subunit [Granulicella tundricola]|uniref:Drug resistance transporter, EmrB/QacA subfamily n=1 Tax=Granulicella tundricola (strain ATCC BAA-1859 / DSM 23138 / MP5ACTX9) TaxID=1198114 RepID=E8WZS8_GRATM|nr:DHA2 family efflux MFS transporter permease subunit [Granulicella tundricola]ADW67739.1 drug resistance transporter, EmrB/QacA subfamily [Granulicella tundricola MP5ACTX9]